MSGQEKTERATPQKLRKAREEGNVSKSQSVNSAAVLIAGLAAGTVFGIAVLDAIRESTEQTLAAAVRPDTNVWTVLETTRDAFLDTHVPMLLPAAAVFGVAGLVAFCQVGPLLVLKPLMPKLERLNPGKGIKNKIFSARAAVELLKSIVIMLVVAVVLWITISPNLATIVMLGRVEPLAGAAFAVDCAVGDGVPESPWLQV